jgi:hypothetical protein
MLANNNNSKNYSGAEIEKAIDNAMLLGFSEGRRKIKNKDIVKMLKSFKSLYEMRGDDFIDVRDWAQNKCLRANDDGIETVDLNLEGTKHIDLE